MQTKKYFIALALTLITGISFAQIDNLTNLSPAWVRSGTRNAATDATDVMVYNPAGMVFLKSGFHVNVGNQTFMRTPSHEYDLGWGMQKHKQDGADLFVPNIYVSYNKNKGSLFGGAYIAGGGATANYPQGSFTTDLIAAGTLAAAEGAYMSVNDQMLKASSMYLTSTIGGAYMINNKISFGLAIRNISATNTTAAGMTLTESPYELPDAPLAFETEDKASGMGIVAGINIKASEKLNMALRYESCVALNFKTSVAKDDFGLAVDGEKNHRDLPGVAGAGISYTVSQKIKVYADFNYYFQQTADWGQSSDLTFNESWSKLAGNASTVAGSVEYSISPAFILSLGGVYSGINYSDQEAYFTKAGTFETVIDNNFSVNTGFAYKITEKIKIDAGLFNSFYTKNKKISSPYGVDVTFNNNIMAFGVGVDMTF